MPDSITPEGGHEPPAPPPPVATGTEDDGFPRELYAPAVEGPVIRPKSKPRVVREDG